MTDDDKRWTRIWLTGGDNTTAWHPMIAEFARMNPLFDPCIGNSSGTLRNEELPGSSGEMPEIFVGVPWKYRIVAYILLVPLGYYVLECMYFYSGLNALGAIGCLSAILGVCAIGIHRAKVAGDRDVAEMNAKYAAARDAQIQRTLERHKAAREAAVAKASIEGEQKDPYDEYDEWLEKKGYCKRWWEGEK